MTDQITVRLAIFTGGSAWNTFVNMTNNITNDFIYIIPVSDDGGSTSEIIHTFGGPGIGDLRSRLIRLANTSTIQKKAVHDLLSFRLPNNLSNANKEWQQILSQNHSLWVNIQFPYKENIMTFLNEFQSRLKFVSSRMAFRSNTLHYHTDTRLHYDHIQPGVDDSDTEFDFRHGSIGNFYLSGATQHFKSLENALEQLSLVLCCPSINQHPVVLPVISSDIEERAVYTIKRTSSLKLRHSCDINRRNSMHHPKRPSECIKSLDLRRITIAAKLSNGETIIGQCEISHPGQVVGESTPDRLRDLKDRTPTTYTPKGSPVSIAIPILKDLKHVKPLSMTPLSSLPSASFHLSKSSPSLFSLSQPSTRPKVCTNLLFSKTTSSLKSRIQRIHYVNTNQKEIVLPMSAQIQQILPTRTCVIYGIGSLYTSLLPSLIVLNAAHAIKPIRTKILILNGSTDRESEGFTGIDFLMAVTDALNYSWRMSEVGDAEYSDYESSGDSMDGMHVDDVGIVEGIKGPHLPRTFVTHLVWLKSGSVSVDVKKIEEMGIVCVGVDRGDVDELYDPDLLEDVIKDILANK